ncbi:MAG: hypothetical protein WA913_00580 [Pricia sp.]
MNPLQKALRSNALFSGLSGILAIVFHQPIAQWYGTENTTVFWIIGIALLYFAATITYEIFKQRPLAVWWIIIQDSLWVIGSIILLALEPFEISNLGKGLIAFVALIVLYMAIRQARALAQWNWSGTPYRSAKE